MCSYYITSSVICQEVFSSFFNFFFNLSAWVSPYLVYTLYHILSRLSRGFLKFFQISFAVVGGSLPHCPLIIAHRTTDCNRQNAQITGKCWINFCAKFPLDKLLGVWYNGISARAHTSAGRQNAKGKSEGCPSLILRTSALPCRLLQL